ncbi:hypothetical protein F4820DRAFT_406369 [Hypoxylon rubiginosum]|uniref:Uncharacterized protein n=1 Tax=Hypoxylon rubiginosum TaxID=110542 RepID=A0ACB9ZD18_9PEZI|nr:hypothetical protein F4820DRAFT_406369 [Hypoxylon rubiginosum]
MPSNGAMIRTPRTFWLPCHDEWLAQRIDNLENLPEFWKMMVSLYKCSPYDLFNWGLRIDPTDEDNILEELCGILPHAAFGGDIVKLRDALQYAITLRVEGHILPIGPLDQQSLAKLVQQGVRLGDDPRSYDTAQLVKMSDAWNDTKRRRWYSTPLLWELANYVQDREVRPASEKTFFVLEFRDVEAIVACIDSLHVKGWFSHSVDQTNDSWLHANRGKWDELKPVGLEQLKAWEKESMLIRMNARAADLPDWSQGQLDVRFWLGPGCDRRFRITMAAFNEKWHKFC